MKNVVSKRVMKFVAIFGIVAFMGSSCAQHICPAYLKKNDSKKEKMERYSQMEEVEFASAK